jgi:RimJ/RimL family protein N-acetyltransferase
VVRDCGTEEAFGTLQAAVSDQGRTAELGWVIAASRKGEDLATEAATAAGDALRARGVSTFVAHVHPTTPRPP